METLEMNTLTRVLDSQVGELQARRHAHLTKDWHVDMSFRASHPMTTFSISQAA